jgi:hypothetical protein
MKRKYSVILGNLGNTCDRFCSGYKDNPSTMEMFEKAAGIPHVQGIEGYLGYLRKKCQGYAKSLS